MNEHPNEVYRLLSSALQDKRGRPKCRNVSDIYADPQKKSNNNKEPPLKCKVIFYTLISLACPARASLRTARTGSRVTTRGFKQMITSRSERTLTTNAMMMYNALSAAHTCEDCACMQACVYVQGEKNNIPGKGLESHDSTNYLGNPDVST